jgi:hypothetical protein
MLCNKTSSYRYVKLNFLNFLIFNCSINGINKWIIINYFLGQLQSVPKVVFESRSCNVYLIQLIVIKFVIDLRQVCGFIGKNGVKHINLVLNRNIADLLYCLSWYQRTINQYHNKLYQVHIAWAGFKHNFRHWLQLVVVNLTTIQSRPRWPPLKTSLLAINHVQCMQKVALRLTLYGRMLYLPWEKGETIDMKNLTCNGSSVPISW